MLRAQRRALIARFEKQAEVELQQLRKEQLQRHEQEQAAKAAEHAQKERQVQADRKRRDDQLKAQEEHALREKEIKDRQAATVAAAAAAKADEEDKRAKAVAAVEAAVAAAPGARKDPKFQQKHEAWLAGPSTEWSEQPVALWHGEEDTYLKEILRVLSVFEYVENEAKRFREDSSVKKMRMDARRHINKAVNQVSRTIMQAHTKIEQVSSALKLLGTMNNPAPLAFGMHLTATLFMDQADQTVSPNPELAFGVAVVIIGITATSPNPTLMRDVVLGAFYRHCIYTRPHFPTRRKGEDPDLFRRRIGFKEGESEADFLLRARGSIHLLAAMFQMHLPSLKLPGLENVSNPFPIDYAWTFLSRIANRRQRHVTPDVVMSFLETAGYGLSQAYGSQFAKLMVVLKKAVLMHPSPYAQTLPLTNVVILVEEYEKNGNRYITVPEGRNLPLHDQASKVN